MFLPTEQLFPTTKRLQVEASSREVLSTKQLLQIGRVVVVVEVTVTVELVLLVLVVVDDVTVDVVRVVLLVVVEV
jgi:hypothetical protein